MAQIHQYGLTASIASKKNLDLKNWIFKKTPKLIDTDVFKYALSTRIFWIRYGMIDFPECVICGKQIGFQHNVKICKGYPDHCSSECAQNDSLVMQRKIDTNMENHGIAWWTNKDLMTQTLLNKYGVDNYTKTDEYKIKQKESFLRHYGVDNNMKCKRGQQEWSDSYKASTGYTHNWKNPECRKIQKQTCIEKYGVDNNMKCEAGKEEWRRSIRNKYGQQYDHNWSVPIVRQHYHDTCQKLYGYENPNHCPAIQKKMKTRYSYDNISFDSKPEIAFYIWLKDNKIDFKYQPECNFWYKYNGKDHKYFPDFEINKKYFEIKGNHMISESGAWICPWDLSKNDYYEAKHQCAISNGVIIITQKDYQKYLDYVSEKYGVLYLDQFKNAI